MPENDTTIPAGHIRSAETGILIPINGKEEAKKREAETATATVPVAKTTSTRKLPETVNPATETSL